MPAATATNAAVAMYQRFRPAGAGARAAGEEGAPETADAGCTAGAEDGAPNPEGPEGIESTGVATLGVDTLKDELLPESISRFSRFRSPRISDATW
jgi:hypothetical protein